ncbi:MAG: hypothetical protein JXA25_16155 [Anaerolineales bacterium]|nr:hypothetical protein [Anaerolineales bacterium]
MSDTFEADVAFLHITAGESRITPPAGVHAQAAPRRAARGRSEDLFFAVFDLTSNQKATDGFLNHLVQLAADVYYGTPGSVTAALRECITAVNDHLLTHQSQPADSTNPTSGHSMIAILRKNHLYIAQSGAAQAILIRRDRVTQMTPDETIQRPLGIGSSPAIRYFHYETLPGDILMLVSGSRTLWSPSTLTGLSGLELARVMDRLIAASAEDCTGVCLKFVQRASRQSVKQTVSTPARAEAFTPQPSAHKSSIQTKKKPGRSFKLGETKIVLQLKRLGYSIVRNFSDFMLRMAPGLMETPQNSAVSPSLLAGTAIVVPILVVAIAALMYLRQGRGEQFDYYFSQAQSAALAAEQSPTIPQQRANLVQALELLDEADGYGVRKTSEDLRTDLLQALDGVDLINRLDFTPIIQGGFAPGATIQALAATVTDVYVLDGTNQSVYRAWSTGRAYEMDGEFDCLSGKASFPGWTTAVDLVVQSSPGALGSEGIVAIDVDGTLVYCAPGASPASSQLTAPDLGWGQIKAIHVQYDSLYVLDPELNAIWIFDAAGGLFTGSPSLYFVEEVPDLSTAIDIAMAQDELYILFEDGSIDRCRRTRETSEEEGTQFRVECVQKLEFQDERTGFPPSSELPNGTPSSMVYSPPPEPSLFFLDKEEGSIFHYSMRLVYQGRYLPAEPWPDPVSTFTLGPLNDLFIAAGDQVYTVPLLQ